MHIDDRHVRGVYLLFTPVVACSSINHIPAKVVIRKYSRLNNRLLYERPFHLPLIDNFGYLEIAVAKRRSNGRRPMQLKADFGIVLRSMQRKNFETIERGKPVETRIIAGKIVLELILGEIGFVC